MKPPMFMFRYMPGFVSMRIFWRLVKIKDISRHPLVFIDRYGFHRIRLWRDWMIIWS